MSKRKEPIDQMPYFMGDLLKTGPYRTFTKKVVGCVNIFVYILIIAAYAMGVITGAAAFGWALGNFFLAGFITSLVLTILTPNSVRFAEMREQMKTSNPDDYMVASSAPDIATHYDWAYILKTYDPITINNKAVLTTQEDVKTLIRMATDYCNPLTNSDDAANILIQVQDKLDALGVDYHADRWLHGLPSEYFNKTDADGFTTVYPSVIPSMNPKTGVVRNFKLADYWDADGNMRTGTQIVDDLAAKGLKEKSMLITTTLVHHTSDKKTIDSSVDMIFYRDE